MPERREDRRTLQSVSIALDVIDALAVAPELSLSELARRVGVAKSTAHRTCSVLAERGLLDRSPHRRLPPRPALRRVRPPGDVAHRRQGPWPPAARRAAQRSRRDGADRRPGRCRRRVRRAGRRRPGPAVLHRELASLAVAPLERRQDPHGASIPSSWKPACGWGCRPAPATRSSCPRCSSPSWPASASGGTPAASTRPSSACRRWPCRCRGTGRRPGGGGHLDGRPHHRVVGEHEAHHVAILQAGARKLGEAVTRGDYTLRRRAR